MPAPGQLEIILAKLSTNRRDSDAWNLFFEMLWPRVKATTYQALGGRLDLAEDAAQEVFLRLLRYCDFGKFPETGSFLAYLHTVSRNAANDIRRETAWQTVDINEREAELWRTFPTQSSEQRAATAELFARVWQFLSEEDRVVASLTAEGNSMGEIALALGLTANAVSVRWFRLRSRVRNLLKEKGIEHSGIK
jgi:RNA polymerase sigma factor (sigma-70 family)